HDARRAGDRVGELVVDDGVLLPDLVAGRRIDRDEASVVGRDEDLALPDRDTAVDDVAAALVAAFAVHLRVVGPDALAGAHVDRVHDAAGGGLVHDAVDDDRRRLDAARRLEVVGPGEAELLDVAVVDFLQLAEARLGVVEAVAQPVLRAAAVGLDRAAVDL